MEGTKCNAQSVSLRIVRELNFVTNVDTSLILPAQCAMLPTELAVNFAMNVDKN
jgi:hypothetical protein